MIKFFRRTRQLLLSENRFSKYLLYAVGEILLVVIGILIALQVDNWDKGREALNYQDTVLKEIRKGLESDIQRYQENLGILKRIDSGITVVVGLMERDPDSMEKSEFYRAANKTVLEVNFGYNAGAYEGLKSTGLEKIRNTGLRSKLISYYEVSLQNARESFQDNNAFFEERQREIRETFIADEVLESRFVPHRDSLVSISLSIFPEKMLKHRLYPEYLKNVMWKGVAYRSELNRLIGESEALIREIDQELNP